MAFLSAKELAETCGFYKKDGTPDLAKISVNKSRGHIVVSGSHYDTNQPQNAAFIEKWSAIYAAKLAENIPPSITKQAAQAATFTPVAPEIEPDGEPFNPETPTNLSELGITQLDKAKKIASIKLDRVRTDLLEIQRQKLKGQLLPTDLVQLVLVQFSKTIFTETSQQLDNTIIDLAAKLNLNNEELATLRASIPVTINQTINNAVTAAQASLDAIIQQYTEKLKAAAKK